MKKIFEKQLGVPGCDSRKVVMGGVSWEYSTTPLLKRNLELVIFSAVVKIESVKF